MSSTPNSLHGILALGSFSAALASFIISVRMGTLQFIKENFVDGLCVDVWEGFFLSPKNLIAIGFLFYLPIHCYQNHAPFTIQFLSSMMGIPSYLFAVAMFLEISPVVLPVGVVIGLFFKFGLSQYRLAQTPKQNKKKPSVSFSPELTSQKIYTTTATSHTLRDQSEQFIHSNHAPALLQFNSPSNPHFIISDSSLSSSNLSLSSITHPHSSPKNPSTFSSSIQKSQLSPTSAISKRKRRES